MARSAQPRDPYAVLGVSRDANDAQIKKAFVSSRANFTRTQPRRSASRGEVQGGRELRDLSDRERRAPMTAWLRGLRSGGYQPNFDQFGSVSDLFEASSVGRRRISVRRAPGSFPAGSRRRALDRALQRPPADL